MKRVKNNIIKYVEGIVFFRDTNDKEGLESLRQDGKGEYVTLEEVGFALVEIIDTLASYTDLAEAIAEERLKAIVSSLPKDIQEVIHTKFDEVSDNLFKEGAEDNE